MAVIRQDDFIQSIADSLQYISYYHPLDFIQAVHEAYQNEESIGNSPRKAPFSCTGLLRAGRGIRCSELSANSNSRWSSTGC